MTKIIKTKHKIFRKYQDLWGVIYPSGKRVKGIDEVRNKLKFVRKRHNFRNVLLLDRRRGKTRKKRKDKSEINQSYLEYQKLKKFYNIKAKQIHKICKNAVDYSSRKTVFNKLVSGLELRLDMLIWRSQIAPSIHFCKQFIAHRNVLVNNKIVDKPSYTLSIGDEITFITTLEDYVELLKTFCEKKIWINPIPSYLEIDYSALRIVVIEEPSVEKLLFTFNADFDNFLSYYNNKVFR